MLSLSRNKVLCLSLNGDEFAGITERLRPAGITTTEVSSIIDAQRELLTGKYNVLVGRSDDVGDRWYHMLEFVRQHKLHAPVIINVSEGSVDEAVKMLKAGASDFVVSSSPDRRLADSIQRVVAERQERNAAETPDDPHHCVDVETVLVGQSPAICEIRSAINLVAKSQTTVLITGESGTGKEVVARFIHMQSNRTDKPFIAVNCAALPRDVIENELFGHEKGAFTGALVKKAGCFELAHEGTLFFDEIAEMTPETQAKLLRALESQSFRRLGGKDEVNVDVRTIAATNKNITTALQTKELREDLYYRISVIEIYIPPLRERREDIPVLIEHFLSIFAEKYGKETQRFSEETHELLLAYDWPGNVRELRNVIERAVVICKNGVIGIQYLPDRLSNQQTACDHIKIPVGSSTGEAERLLILQTLESVGNNKSKAARILGLSRKTLHNKLQKFGQ